MNTTTIKPAAIFLAFSFLLTSTCVGAKPPEWLKIALEQPLSIEQQKADAVVLLDEGVFNYSEKGVLKSSARWAVKINDKGERDRAIARISFEEGHSKITHFRAWFIDPKGKTYRHEKKDTWDIATSGSSLHSDLMKKVFDMSDSVRDGCVFAYEYEKRTKTVFSQLYWYMSKNIPVLRSSITVIPPDNWKVIATPLNGTNVNFKLADEGYVWEALNLPEDKFESNGPPSAAVRTMLGLDIRPLRKSSSSPLILYQSWNDVATYDAKINDVQIEPSQAIRDKAKELSKNTNDSWSILAKVAAYTQSINYVSIETNLSLGGGYQPFKAEEVFKRHYGDCKDKTALTRSLLKVLGMKSYAVSADAGRGAHVDPSWPSLHQFNHCIVAIPVDDSIDCEAIVDDPKLGRLLIFDPTSQLTPFGNLPVGMAGSLILIGSDQVNGLLKIPDLQPESDHLTRNISIQLTAEGDISATLKEDSTGNSAIRERGYHRNKSESAYNQFLVDWLSIGSGSSTIHSYSFGDDFESNKTSLDVVFTLPTFARSMRGKYLVFKPFALNQATRLSEDASERKTPYRVRSRIKEETITIEIPEGFIVDDHMEPLIVENDFGRYESKIEEQDGSLVCYRRSYFKAQEVPLDRYGEIVDFYDTVSRAEQTPVVLARQ